MFRDALVNRINFRVALTTHEELEDEVLKFVTDIQHSAWEATLLLTTKVKATPTRKKSGKKLRTNAKSEKGGK
jgi:hypothetical protein